MKMSNCLYWLFLVDLRSKFIPICLIHMKEMSFSTKRKVVKDN